MKPYEGNENYIFVSYAHKDAGFVLPIIENLHDLGYRIWFDEGIEASAEWPEFIEDHLGRSAAVLAFVSNDFVKSQNCRKEITFALNHNIPLICVMPEKVELGKGLNLQLADQQQIDLSSMSPEKFYQKLMEVGTLESCRYKTADGSVVKTHKSLRGRKRKQTTKKTIKWMATIIVSIIVFVLVIVLIDTIFPDEENQETAAGNEATTELVPTEKEHTWVADAGGAFYCTGCGVQTGKLEGEQKQLSGVWSDYQITLLNSDTTFFVPTGLVENCVRLTLNIKYDEVEGDPYGKHVLFIKDASGTWTDIAEYVSTEQMTKESVSIPLEFETPVTFSGITTAFADEKDVSYSMLQTLVITDVEVIRKD